MKFALLMAMIVVTGCRPQTKDNKTIIKSEEWPFVFKIELPVYYDTLHSWINYTDYTCGDKKMYRAQPKNLGIYEESGFIYKYPKRLDSIEMDQFTISFVSDTNCRKERIRELNSDEVKKYFRLYDELTPINEKGDLNLIKVENKNFIYTIKQDTLNGIVWQKLSAFTIYESVYITFDFEERTNIRNSNNHFCERSLNYLKTLSILSE